MSLLKNYNNTIVACYIGYIVQAIVNNFVPLLFITFQNTYNISLDRITLLVTVNFGVQLLVDLLSSKLVDKTGWRTAMIAAHVFAALGLAGLTLLPELFGDAFYGLLLAVIFYAVGGGLLEVCVSPIVEACPTKRKAAAMSLLHSFYCWGSVAVILASSLYFLFRGTGDWKVMALIWAAVPALNCIYFMLVPMPEQEAEAKSGSFKALFGNKIFWLMALLMICAGASELCIAQWASSFAESGLGVSKVVGDIAGPCAFAFLMGVSRLVFAKLSEKVRLEPMLLVSGVLCAGGYLIIALSPNAVLSLVGCGICGFAVGAMWPGTFSLSAGGIKGGGTMMFAFLALAGDIGCTAGPTLVGFVTDALGGKLQKGLSFGIIFPVILCIGLAVFMVINAKNKKKTMLKASLSETPGVKEEKDNDSIQS